MGRYCEDLEDMKDSGVLSSVIYEIIGDERYNDGWFKLSHKEVRLVLFDMGKRLDSMQAIKNGALSYQDINVKAMGYNKLERLMRWWYDNNDTFGDAGLVFA